MLANMQVSGGPKDWENPGVFAHNKCRSHVPLRAHPSQQSALHYFVHGPNTAANANVDFLNSSEWLFRLFDRPEHVTKGFNEVDFDDGQWGKVRVFLLFLTLT
jgi:hypothetical protein